VTYDRAKGLAGSASARRFRPSKMPFIHHTRALTLTRPRGVALHLYSRAWRGRGRERERERGLRKVCASRSVVHALSVGARRTGEGEESFVKGVVREEVTKAHWSERAATRGRCDDEAGKGARGRNRCVKRTGGRNAAVVETATQLRQRLARYQPPTTDVNSYHYYRHHPTPPPSHAAMPVRATPRRCARRHRRAAKPSGRSQERMALVSLHTIHRVTIDDLLVANSFLARVRKADQRGLRKCPSDKRRSRALCAFEFIRSPI